MTQEWPTSPDMEIFSRNLINPDVTKGEKSFAKLQNLLID
jgi:hypothetical protein